MTYGARLILIILAFQFLIANPVLLEYPIIPKINCNDLNGNGHSDFIAVNSSTSPRSLYHIEFNSPNIKFIWEYSMPENIQGYFSDMILGDFDNDGGLELIVTAYKDGSKKIFYVFSVDSTGINSASHKVMGISNSPFSITHPGRLYPMDADSKGHVPFILTQASPSRYVVICKYLDGEILSVGSYGKNFLRQSTGPLELSLGNFDGDSIKDIFILSNGTIPQGYFIFSDGSEKKAGLDNYPRLRLLYNKGIDLNIDGTDDVLMVNRNGGLMSNIWGTESIALSESNIQNIFVGLDNGLIHLNSISRTGKIGHYIIDPITQKILTSQYDLPEFTDLEFTRSYSLVTTNQILLVNNGQSPELWSLPLASGRTEAPLHTSLQRIYSRRPDYVINVDDIFVHPIEKDTTKAFLHFTGDYLPDGMEFNLDDVQLEWTPTKYQLGFHEFSYGLELREKGQLKMGTDNGKRVVSQQESLINKNYTYLAYVNHPVKFSNDNDHFTIVNTDPFDWFIPIDDYNVDVTLTVSKLSEGTDAIFQLVQPENTFVPLDVPLETNKEKLDVLELGITRDSMNVVTIEKSMNIDKAQTEGKLIDDSLKKLTLETTEEKSIVDTVIYNNEFEKDSIEITPYKEISYSEIAPHKAKFSWTPNINPDNYFFTLTVSDGYNNDTLDITLIVHPEIDLSMNKTKFIASVNKLFSTKLNLEQRPSSTSFSYRLINAPENMRITNSGLINWIPLATQLDDYSFIVEVSDGIAVSNLQYNIYVNIPPVISSRPSEQFIINLGDSLSFPLESFDMNIDTKLTWKLLSGPKDMILNPTGVLQWAGNQLDHNPYEIQLSDGIDSVQWHGSIYVNVPPTINSRPLTFISENQIYEYQLDARDDNNINPFDPYVDNKIEYQLLQGPADMKIDYQNILRWEPAENISGEYFISIIATDGIDNTLQNFQLLVNSVSSIVSTDSFSVKIGDTLSVHVTADALNLNDSLFYFIDDMRQGMNLDNNSGLITWIPSISDIGQHNFKLLVKDGILTSDTNHELQIFVYMPPIFTGDLSIEAFVDLEYVAFLTGEDMFGNKLRDEKTIFIEQTSIKEYVLSEYGRYLQWIPGKMDIGNHEIHIRIIDDYGFTKLHTHKISVFKNPCFQCNGHPGNSPPDTTAN